jgi:hypothetical protein
LVQDKDRALSATAGIAGTIPRIAEKRERSPGPKDDVSGWALVSIRCQTLALHNIFTKSTKFIIDRLKYTLYDSYKPIKEYDTVA